MEKKIAIIGAGISGLLACKHITEQGFNPIVFEARNGIGGVWSQTIESTKLQTPKSFYQFSDFEWPSSVEETFPDHNQVMEYLHAYAVRFNILDKIKYKSRVSWVDYEFVSCSEKVMVSGDFWGGAAEAFSATGRWIVCVENLRDPSASSKVYEFDFVILCIGRYSDLPNIPDFPKHRGPDAFNGLVLHSMDYAAMDDDIAAELIKNKLVTVVGFQKSAIDIAAEVAARNGSAHPCTLLFRTAHWTVPDYLLALTFKSLNRATELMVHKPDGGFFMWLLAILLSPLIFSKFIEYYLKFTQPLKKYNMVPSHGFLKQISSCMFTVLPAKFYERVKEGSLILKKSQSFSFCNSGLMVDGMESPTEADIVILGTGYRSDEKLSNIFKSSHFQQLITRSSTPLYRECIHPQIPNLAILGYADSPSVLYTTEMRSKWVAHFLGGTFKLPTIKEMEAEVKRWEGFIRSYNPENYKRSCVSVMLQIYCNDQICKDMGYINERKKWIVPEIFAAYGPTDYKTIQGDSNFPKNRVRNQF